MKPIPIVTAVLSNIVPESDYIIARKLSKLHLQWHDLSAELDARPAQRNAIEWRMVALKRAMTEVMNAHDARTRAFYDWLEEGKPDL